MEVVIILILILLNGVFSMSEIALVSARKVRLEHQANRGDEKAKAALKLANNPDKFLSTVQIGITLIGILTGIYSGEKLKSDLVAFVGRIELLQPYSNGIATGIIVIVITYFSLVLGELVPKRLGMARPEAIAKAVARPMTWVSRLTFPFISLLSVSTNLIVKVFNLKKSDQQVTEEEIKAMISEGTTSGAIEETEQEIIERVFHLGDRNITSLMTHRTDIVWLDINESVESVKRKINQSLHSVYPVCEGQIDSIKGIISIKDLYGAAASNNYALKPIIRKPLFVPENNSAYQVLEKFKETQIHAAFIVDEYGTFLGMITLNDILEAIVGDMPDAGQLDDYEMTKRDDGSYLVDAQIPFYDFLSEFDKEDWMAEFEQEFDTLAGFILHHLEHIPQTGEKFEWRGFTFEIVDMDVHRIDKVLVYTPVPREEEGE
ncbi:MAG TPA: hemolysin family protein [Chitinophaga sp.]|jgi:putative hemolysin|uniref:hemolysin family protein n=1 Tax=Chitinophaga sp. TaxID=1869181 RepID=UPI002DBA6FEC|nr:hemolysin family protein [Chitinophaga sp.]HEU4555910.1 hemolysin family protein [Chitinophaga sp.]